MKKIFTLVLVMVFTVVLFSGCTNAVISNNGEILLSEALTADTEFPEPIDNGSDTSDIVTWQKIYAALLHDFAEQFTDEWETIINPITEANIYNFIFSIPQQDETEKFILDTLRRLLL